MSNIRYFFILIIYLSQTFCINYKRLRRVYFCNKNYPYLTKEVNHAIPTNLNVINNNNYIMLLFFIYKYHKNSLPLYNIKLILLLF